MGQGLVVSEGDYWLKHRRLMQPVFHQKYIESLFSTMLSCTESLLQIWEKKPDGEVIDIADAMMPLTLKIAGLTLFSTDISDEESVFGKAFRTGFEFISYKMNNLPTEPMWAPTPRNLRFRQAVQTLDDLVFDIINKRRQNPTNNHDLLSLLLDDEIKGYFIPKGSTINICQYIVHRHPEFWDNPEKFEPDNFLPSKVNQRPKFAYFPFGAGQRICIGKSFALMEATIILVSIFQRFRLELVPQQIELDPTFTLRPKNGVKVKVWKRS